MAQFFGLMSEFAGHLQQLDDHLVQLAPARHVDAARFHVRQSSEWISNVLGPGMSDYHGMVVGPSIVEGANHAFYMIGQRNFVSPEGFVDTFGMIDRALGQTYFWIQSHDSMGTITIGPPSTYEKTLSVLPGDPYFPTDPAPVDPSQRIGGKTEAGSPLYGNAYLPTEPVSPPTKQTK